VELILVREGGLTREDGRAKPIKAKEEGAAWSHFVVLVDTARKNNKRDPDGPP